MKCVKIPQDRLTLYLSIILISFFLSCCTLFSPSEKSISSAKISANNLNSDSVNILHPKSKISFDVSCFGKNKKFKMLTWYEITDGNNNDLIPEYIINAGLNSVRIEDHNLELRIFTKGLQYFIEDTSDDSSTYPINERENYYITGCVQYFDSSWSPVTQVFKSKVYSVRVYK